MITGSAMPWLQPFTPTSSGQSTRRISRDPKTSRDGITWHNLTTHGLTRGACRDHTGCTCEGKDVVMSMDRDSMVKVTAIDIHHTTNRRQTVVPAVVRHHLMLMVVMVVNRMASRDGTVSHGGAAALV